MIEPASSMDEHHGEGTGQLLEDGYPVDDLELTTVGIDIGSATSHLMFSRLHLRRLGRHLSSRYVVIGRRLLYRSPILLTPFTDASTIDPGRLQQFVLEAFAGAGLAPETIDSGAVILTGEAMRRTNARAVAELFAGETGKFVCATAGHHLEAVVAAHGSGAVASSRLAAETLLNVDVGGGTSKLALVRQGTIVETAAVNVGGRLVAMDEDGRLNRIEPAARRVADALGVPLRAGRRLGAEDQRRLAGALAGCLLAAMRREALPAWAEPLMLTAPLRAQERVHGVTFSGGVAEYIYGREPQAFADIARPLADAIREGMAAAGPAPLRPGGEGIRATVIGASQFTVQVSGDTVTISCPERLPLRNLPVLPLALRNDDIIEAGDVETAILAGLRRAGLTDGERPIALAIDWNGTPRYQTLRNLAEGIIRGMPQGLKAGYPLVLVFSADFGKLVGEILRDELEVANDVISIDSIELRDLDYVDIGHVIQPARVVPVVVKSLLFGPDGADQHCP